MKQYVNAMVAFTNPEHVMAFFIKHITLTQYRMKKGIELWGERSVEAVKREMEQFHDRGVMSLIDPKTMSKEDKKKALTYLMFLKEKCRGVIKGEGYSYGRKQQIWYLKE